MISFLATGYNFIAHKYGALFIRLWMDVEADLIFWLLGIVQQQTDVPICLCLLRLLEIVVEQS